MTLEDLKIKIAPFLEDKLAINTENISISQFKGGYSNLTYLIKAEDKEFILRRPPLGKKISKAHDMIREFKVLEALQKAGYKKIPKPILSCEDEAVIGSPFFIMEKVDGLILRNQIPEGINLSSRFFQDLSKNTIDAMLELHQLELKDSGLLNLGKPDGYVERQVSGWSERYLKAKTDEIPAMEFAIEWLKSNCPTSKAVSFLNNDFKYDNIVLRDESNPEIKAILDWEMATVGDPLMDLGTSLAYWAEKEDAEILKMFNLTHPDGNMTRSEVINYYGKKSGLDMSNMLFYYVFGVFKVGVIAQQIYQRHMQGFAPDPRFAGLIHVVKACGKTAKNSIETGKI
ncbi:phosphotransferase family protein [Belliella aquatica]|uniref:Phosphotransferase family protein n=1 Tax=Belliella aquatica TaxID=1323734 RepID=A0ABQ1MRW8_9BACT|nr:phosphotransferase family protein [Belliella aquatica]MCH7406373.1 phosphotransferase family protein [Belliella aquatica]GGC45546.1 phosphotransferase family protein [Belliella aquatica]